MTAFPFLPLPGGYLNMSDQPSDLCVGNIDSYLQGAIPFWWGEAMGWEYFMLFS
jgi:hypothetical protein